MKFNRPTPPGIRRELEGTPICQVEDQQGVGDVNVIRKTKIRKQFLVFACGAVT